MIRIALIVLICFVAGKSSAQIDTTCPVAQFGTLSSVNWCPAGELTIDWSFCDPDDLGYWTADSVLWNMGDGSIAVSLGTSDLSHSFYAGDTVNITANAYFTGVAGETCIVGLIDPLVSADPCNDSTAQTAYLQAVLYRAEPSVYFSTNDACEDSLVSIYNSGYIIPIPGSYSNWYYTLYVDGDVVASGSGIPSSGTSLYADNFSIGDHMVEIVYYYDNGSTDSCARSNTALISVAECDSCMNCNTFRPITGERYWLSAWVKENHTTPVMNYENSMIRLAFEGAGTDVELQPSGDLVEGWQRVVGSFTIPSGTTDLEFQLINLDTEIDVFFDDIRIHPFNSSMKSYVYDPQTLWLTAELDDNNYATFYEYDLEGQLIRIKKETSRGIMTIQESRSNNPKE